MTYKWLHESICRVRMNNHGRYVSGMSNTTLSLLWNLIKLVVGKVESVGLSGWWFLDAQINKTLGRILTGEESNPALTIWRGLRATEGSKIRLHWALRADCAKRASCSLSLSHRIA